MHIKFNSLLYLRCVILVHFLCKGDNLDGVSLGSQSCVSMFLYSMVSSILYMLMKIDDLNRFDHEQLRGDAACCRQIVLLRNCGIHCFSRDILVVLVNCVVLRLTRRGDVTFLSANLTGDSRGTLIG